jgi:hypothetical protein
MTRLDKRSYPADHDPSPRSVALWAAEVLATSPVAIQVVSRADRHD